MTTLPQKISTQLHPRFCSAAKVRKTFEGKTVAIVGSGPGVLENPIGFVDSHDVVVRVNNYKLSEDGRTGSRTDVFYSYFGNAIRKTAEELKQDGVRLCMAKCPNGQPIESNWHRLNRKMNGVDFRYIYEHRDDWWFCDTYVPTSDEFLEHFEMLEKHLPTTGFCALLDVLKYKPRHVFLTGFDFFQSKVHNVNERWKGNNPTDPIGHRPDLEREWLAKNLEHLPLTMDAMAYQALRGQVLPQWTPEFRTKWQQTMESRREREKLRRLRRLQAVAAAKL